MVWDEDIENEEQAKKAGYSDYRAPGSILENARIGPNGAVGSVRLGNSASDVSYVGLAKGEPGIFDRFASWLKSFQSKDAPVGEGLHAFNNANHEGGDPNADLKPNSIGKTDNLGDISWFLSYAGQLRTNNSYNPSNPWDSYATFSNAKDVTTKVGNLMDTETPEPRQYIDPIRKDTVSNSEAIRRQIKRFGNENWSNWIFLSKSEYKY